MKQLEALSRAKDHDIDVLNLMHVQKDSNIIDLEEQGSAYQEIHVAS